MEDADAIVYDEATGGKLREIKESGGGKTSPNWYLINYSAHDWS